MAQFTMLLGNLAGVDVLVSEVTTYEELALAMRKHKVDLAWLPPIPLIRLEQRASVVPLVSHHRDGATRFHSTMIVRKTSPIVTPTDLRGTHAAWVDPHSASGYVLPRIGLAALGVDPRTSFESEQFFHSHEEVVRAVESGRVDCGGTYAGLDSAGAVVRGPWTDLPGIDESIRVLATFGAIPGDTIAARIDLAPVLRDKLARALVAASADRSNRLLLRDVFGIDEFRRWVSGGYDALRRATKEATQQGLLGEAPIP